MNFKELTESKKKQIADKKIAKKKSDQETAIEIQKYLDSKNFGKSMEEIDPGLWFNEGVAPENVIMENRNRIIDRWYQYIEDGGITDKTVIIGVLVPSCRKVFKFISTAMVNMVPYGMGFDPKQIRKIESDIFKLIKGESL